MAAPKGNQFWRRREVSGRTPLYTDPEKLWQDCLEYFEWCDANPLQYDKIMSAGGDVVNATGYKLRAYTIDGLCLRLDIDRSTWKEWRKRKDISAVVARADATIRSQQIEGATAELLNPNIVARLNGLSERQEVTGKDGGPIEMADLSDVEKARRLAFLLRSGAEEAKDEES